MTEIQQLKKTIADALKRVEELELAQAAKSAPVKWEPKGGDYYVYHAGIVVHSISSEDTRLFGSERETQEQAEHATEWMRKFNRLMCWFEENAPEHNMEMTFGISWAGITFRSTPKVIDDLRTKIRDGVVEL
jgi:hydrogenase maturation factor